VPDLGIGRLVEQPADIVRYLKAYVDAESFVVRADVTPLGSSEKALVTGYDFLTDQANAIGQQLALYGLGSSNTNLPVSLIGDQWSTDQLTSFWFNNQLPLLTNPYSRTNNGPATRYFLASINGHFSHFGAEPAAPEDISDFFAAERLLTPTVSMGGEPAAFFKIGLGSDSSSATLLYSIGCHSGLSAPDSAFISSTLAADFASAVLKQGGNWIGNTTYGYGDTTAVAYSERLALLFTEELGRKEELSGNYVGVAIGTALARAKQQYIKQRGLSNFSVSDEKVMTSFTLYGLPFIRVRVPSPQVLPTPRYPALPNASAGLFTRIITVTSSFSDESGPNGRIPKASATVQDSLLDSFTQNSVPFIVTSTPQGSWGSPALPVLTIDMGVPGVLVRSEDNLPQLRGVRLLRAVALPDIAGYDPQVTTPITDTASKTAGRPTEDPLSLRNLWAPDVFYGVQRTKFDFGEATDVLSDTVSDLLVVHPAQFRAISRTTGELRRFQELIFEVTYLDPSTAGALKDDRTLPAISDEQIDVTTVSVARQLIGEGAGTVRFRARITDTSGIREARAFYTLDGLNWTSVRLTPVAAGSDLFTASEAVQLRGKGIFAYFDAIDEAGNSTVRVQDQTLRLSYLPIVHK
jgi:hypothetical protein